ncbi:uncharacterized protein [Miscanthus floridulus]|uniref:uncharacterized protein n=1 Tax=Miscanthus floridulus TaxID=154761 RepID=UPI003458B04D
MSSSSGRTEFPRSRRQKSLWGEQWKSPSNKRKRTRSSKRNRGRPRKSKGFPHRARESTPRLHPEAQAGIAVQGEQQIQPHPLRLSSNQKQEITRVVEQGRQLIKRMEPLAEENEKLKEARNLSKKNIQGPQHERDLAESNAQDLEYQEGVLTEKLATVSEQVRSQSKQLATVFGQLKSASEQLERKTKQLNNVSEQKAEQNAELGQMRQAVDQLHQEKAKETERADKLALELKVQEAKVQKENFDAVITAINLVLDCVDLELATQHNDMRQCPDTVIQRCKEITRVVEQGRQLIKRMEPLAEENEKLKEARNLSKKNIQGPQHERDLAESNAQDLEYQEGVLTEKLATVSEQVRSQSKQLATVFGQLKSASEQLERKTKQLNNVSEQKAEQNAELGQMRQAVDQLHQEKAKETERADKLALELKVQEAKVQKENFDAVITAINLVLDCVDLELATQHNDMRQCPDTVIQRCKFACISAKKSSQFQS